MVTKFDPNTTEEKLLDLLEAEVGELFDKLAVVVAEHMKRPIFNDYVRRELFTVTVREAIPKVVSMAERLR